MLEIADGERRPLLTEDRDFGRLVFAAELASSPGVVLIRCPETSRPTLPTQILELVERLGYLRTQLWASARVRHVSVRRGATNVIPLSG